MKLSLTKKFEPKYFWCPLKANSYDLVFRYIMSARSDGKTTNAIIDAINDYNKYETQFVYCRRYESECKVCNSILDDKISERVVFKGDGNGGGIYIVNKKIIGYLIPLSKQAKYKSGNFENVGTFIYDEVTLDRKNHLQRYIPNEMNELNNLLSTIFRLRINYKVWLLGNNLDYMNPFFSYYNIPELNQGQIYTDRERELYIEIVTTKEALKKDKEKTPLAKLTKGTAFEDFNIHNALLDTINYKIRPKRNADKLYVRLIYDKVMFNIYISYSIYVYVEMSRRIVEDDYSILIKQGEHIHYINIKQFKLMNEVLYSTILKNFLSNKYIEYNNKNCGNMFTELIVRYLK